MGHDFTHGIMDTATSRFSAMTVLGYRNGAVIEIEGSQRGILLDLDGGVFRAFAMDETGHTQREPLIEITLKLKPEDGREVDHEQTPPPPGN